MRNVKELKMKNRDYQKSFTVNMDAEKAFLNISDVGRWWTSSFKGSAKDINDEFDVAFGKTTVNFKVTESVFYKKLVWLVTDCNLDWLKDKKEWKGTEIVWDITENNKTTKIVMTHIGLVPGIECYNDCEAGWNEYLGESLPALISTGKGTIFESSGGK
jgi:hypothetical protein